MKVFWHPIRMTKDPRYVGNVWRARCSASWGGSKYYNKIYFDLDKIEKKNAKALFKRECRIRMSEITGE